MLSITISIRSGSVYEFLLLQETERSIYLSDIVLIFTMMAVGVILTIIILRWRLAVPADSAPQFYRYDLQIRHCPYCEQPMAGAGGQVCTNCGHTLALENQ